MNISKTDIDGLNAVLSVKLSPPDYQPKYEQALKSYQKKVQMPGFRQGKVPVGLVKKMYGKSILADEINKILSDSIHQYIHDSKLEILGNPLPKAEDNATYDWDNPKDFEFLYELGLAPKFNIELSSKDKFTDYKIKADEALLSKYVSDIAHRYGSISNAEEVTEKDFLYGDFVEVDANNEIIPGGIFKSTSIFVERVTDAETKKKLIGLKPQDKVVVDAKKISENATDRSVMLGIDKEKAENLNNNFQFTLQRISRLVPSEVNQQLFDKIYGEGAIKSEQEFREKLKAEIENNFNRDGERQLFNDIVDSLIKKASFSLPDEFLKKWLMAVNEKPLTYEEVSKEYNTYANSLKWQLIENKLIKDNNISVTKEEAAAHLKNGIIENYKKYNIAPPADKELEDMVAKNLSNKEESKKLYDSLYEKKVLDLLKSKCSLDTKEVTQEEFIKIISKN